MTRLILVLLIISAVLDVRGYSPSRNSRLEIDTLDVINDSILVKVSVFTENKLVSESIGFIFHDIRKVRFSRYTGTLLNRKIHVYRLHRDGEAIDYHFDRGKVVTKYENDIEVNRSYYNLKNEQVERSEYYGEDLIIGPCSSKSGFYIVEGGKSK